MYAAKAAGKGDVAVFHEDLLVAARLRLDLREDLRRAIENHELSLAYQPLVDLNAGRAIGVEALMRWQHPQDGPIPPARFIPLAEENGMIVALGRWALDRALAELHAWSELAPELRLNLNVAPRELYEDDYVDAVGNALSRHDVAPERLTLEVTESAFLGHSDASKRLEELADLGVRLAIDDFGTGQSSLARLQRFPVTQVKVDRSFLSGIDENAHSATLVQSIIEMGAALGLQMVAEGIERESQLDVLRASPCPLGQGYLFGRPQAPEAITQLLMSAGLGKPTVDLEATPASQVR
jgi:EAL domain-containing protein (putative c-di-GMP-specific phosphodiesterase class I)